VNTCATCKHWEQLEPNYPIWERAPSEHYGRCERIVEREDLIQRPFSADSSHIAWSSVNTHQAFGCILHEPKDAS